MSQRFSNSKSSASGCCLDFALFFEGFSLILLTKVMLITKACIATHNGEELEERFKCTVHRTVNKQPVSLSKVLQKCAHDELAESG